MAPTYKLPPDLRFWRQVKFGEGMDDCWEWTGHCYPTGHGEFYLYDPRHCIKAHRALWIMYNGPLKRSDFICHKCNNAKCVRLDHLYKGTHQTNMRDRIGSRTRKGLCKLNWTKIRYIRESEGYIRGQSLAKLFGVTPDTISRIRTGNYCALRRAPARAEA